jgi:hypothetical protein
MIIRKFLLKHDTDKKIELTIAQRVMIRSYSQCSANFLICPVPFSLVRVRTEGRKDKAQDSAG